MRLCFASHNKNKITELQALIGNSHELIGLDDLDLHDEIPETGVTLEENALIKANYVYSKFKIPCFADDTGLEVDGLNGEPGVYSARYAGADADSEKNIDKLLNKLESINHREARFRTVIAYLDDSGAQYFVGTVDGAIIESRIGQDGFGYDPVFLPTGFDRTFAEMTMTEKNLISHRGKAVRKFVEFLSKLK